MGNAFALSKRSGISTVFAASITSMPARHAAMGNWSVDRLMWAAMIIKVHPRSDAVSRFAPVGIGFQMHFLVLDRTPQPFDEILSMKRPRPSIEIAMPAASSLPVKAELVN